MFLPVVLCDLDAAYLGFELLRRPELRGLCVIIGGSPQRRGVVCTASYEARRFGVHSAMSTAEALRRCPTALLLPVDMPYYTQMARRFREVVTRGVPVWEPVASDEVYLDLSGLERSLPDTAVFCDDLRQRVRDGLGLSCSVGASVGRALAKVVCELRAKPGGVALLSGEAAAGFLSPLEVGVLPGVGPQTAAALGRYGVRTCGQLAAVSEPWLVRRLGTRAGELRALAAGIDHSRPHPPGPPKSLSVDETFAQDLRAEPQVRRALAALSWELGTRLAAEGLWPHAVGLRWRTARFVDHSRQRTLPVPIQSRQALREIVWRLWEEADVREPVRLLGVQAGRLTARRGGFLPEDRLERVLGDLEAEGVRLVPASLLEPRPQAR